MLSDEYVNTLIILLQFWSSSWCPDICVCEIYAQSVCFDIIGSASRSHVACKILLLHSPCVVSGGIFARCQKRQLDQVLFGLVSYGFYCTALYASVAYAVVIPSVLLSHCWALLQSQNLSSIFFIAALLCHCHFLSPMVYAKTLVRHPQQGMKYQCNRRVCSFRRYLAIFWKYYKMCT